jgi:lysophospholipase
MLPNLTSRFLPPAGWRTHKFTNPKTGHTIYYGSVFPTQETPPLAVIVCLGGLSEFSEKYYELAHDMLDRNYAFWFMDWQYQGRSGRLPDNPHKRHSDGFDKDVSDLLHLVADYVKPSAVHPDKGRIPLIMLAHSMGANIGMQFLSKHPGYFDAAAFSAPLLKIYNFGIGLKFLAAVLRPFSAILGKHYVFGGHDWQADERKNERMDLFSHDDLRGTLHNAWCEADQILQVGSPTFGWVFNALAACKTARAPKTLSAITVPVLMAAAGNDRIVESAAIEKAAKHLKNATFLRIDGAYHEIFMESDAYRGAFMNAFDKMVKQNKIATLENLKKF